MRSGVLVVGVGNRLRRDDGVGPAVAREVASMVEAEVLEVHQLLPEHIEAAARAQRVVLVDAAVDLAPGEIRRTPIRPTDTGWQPAAAHLLGPQELVNGAYALFEGRPEVWLVSVGAGNLELGEALSPAVEAALPEAVAAVVALVETA